MAGDPSWAVDGEVPIRWLLAFIDDFNHQRRGSERITEVQPDVERCVRRGASFIEV